MPHQPRLLLSHSCYHVMTRGNNRKKVFINTQDYQYFYGLLMRFKKNHPFDLYHYCLMPNHIHLLARTSKASDFSNFMKKLNLAYCHYYKQHYGWIGHFWQGRYKSQPVGKDEYFVQAGKYIELNPIRAKLVKDIKEYPYSSYNYYATGENDPLITEDLFYQDLGKNKKERQQNYQDLVISDIIEKSYNKPQWGSESQRHNEYNKIKYNLGKTKI